ncbi:MFS general substrate transporter [Mycena albidolilacea]|uniref:MFS general substrate transporter n=1 Tax=Mycena albidolilacea TaxID=1033008 RepID=A0AAD7F4E7_9AGAR|nr:MFS general substrate transporter [Mycena albidolilacea]
MDDRDDERDTLLLTQDRQIDPDAAFGGRLGRNELEARLVSKLDTRMSILILIHILNYLDRNNASAARLHGFERDLNLTGSQFASVLSILYVGYLVMQIPSNMFLNYIGRPSRFLPLCMAVWGLISVSTGFATNFRAVMVTRFFIGFTEAAFFPGAWFLISKWYSRRELSQRTALLACGSLISNAIGSLVASGILDSMEGRLGYAAWRWLFFIEGGATVVVAIAAMFILPDFPENSSNWLSPAEQSLAMRRMAEDAGMDEDPDPKHGSTAGLYIALSDGKVWWLALTLTSIVLSVSFNAYFPTLAETMGYSRTLTLLLCAPPWFFATFVGFAISRHSDQVGERFWHIVVPLLIGILGFLLAMSTMNTFVRYISLFLMAQSYAGFIIYLSWASGTIRPAYKRAVALAFINMVSSLGNIAGSYIWPSTWGPSYKASYSICIFASTLGILLCFMFRQHLASLNASAERIEAEMDEPKGYRYLL